MENVSLRYRNTIKNFWIKLDEGESGPLSTLAGTNLYKDLIISKEKPFLYTRLQETESREKL